MCIRDSFTTVETNDLKNAIEEATGQNLHWFFEQWVYKAGSVSYTHLTLPTSDLV